MTGSPILPYLWKSSGLALCLFFSPKRTHAGILLTCAPWCHQHCPFCPFLSLPVSIHLPSGPLWRFLLQLILSLL